jgi:phage gp36-like protein
MAYATIADLERRLPQALLAQITGETAGSGPYNTALTEALTWASGQVDAYAGTRFSLPLQPSEQIEKLTVDIAAYSLEETRNVIRESEEKAYDRAMAFLKDLSKGLATLDQPSGEEPQATSAETLKDEDEKVFSDDNLSNF